MDGVARKRPRPGAEEPVREEEDEESVWHKLREFKERKERKKREAAAKAGAAAAEKDAHEGGKKGGTDELDAIFADAKSKRRKKGKIANKALDGATAVQGGGTPGDDGLCAPDRADRRTEEGYRIYTAEELGIGKGGGTADCPFDCDCCF